MRERFLLEYTEAASTNEAAFIMDKKSGLRVQIIRFSTLKQLDLYKADGFSLPIRNLPILLVAQSNELPEKSLIGIMKRIVDWYYYTVLRG